MASEFVPAPYYEKMLELINKIPADETPADDLKAKISGNCKTVSSEVIEKGGLASFEPGGGVRVGMCFLLPKAACVLPVFASLWEERAHEVKFMVDIMPTVDTLVDEPYRKKYIEPMGDLWDRFSNLAGMGPEEDDELRSACSIIYTAARVPIEKEGLRLAALAPHTEYLKRYIEFLDSAVPAGNNDKSRESLRKTSAIRDILKNYVTRVFTGSANGDIRPDVAEVLCNHLL